VSGSCSNTSEKVVSHTFRLVPAGVTVYAPLRKFVKRPDCKVAVLGVGGLGHLAVQFADKMGADVSVCGTHTFSYG